MGTKPQPAPEDSEDRFDSPADMFEPVNLFKKLKKFLATRNAVLGGEPLYDFPKRKLEEDGLMGPWEFNIMQSTIAGLPGSLIVTALNSTSGPEDKIIEILIPIALPFSLLIFAYTIGWASLWKKDSNPAARYRAARLFLYLDGAYGLAPQFLLSTLYSFASVVPVSEIVRPVNLTFWPSVWQLYVYLKTIPEELFSQMGYTSEVNPAFTTLKVGADLKDVARQKPPVWKYRLAVLVLAPLMVVAVLVCVVSLGFLLAPLWHKT